MLRLSILVIGVAILPQLGHAGQFNGKPRVIDAGTIQIGGQRIKLGGIVAPDDATPCRIAGKKWRCGWEASNALANLLGRHWVTCVSGDIAAARATHIVSAQCSAGPIDVNRWMVRQGWALPHPVTGGPYLDDRNMAKQERLGLWRGAFELPSPGAAK